MGITGEPRVDSALAAPERRDEVLAERIVATALGCEVRHVDGTGVQGHVDAETHLDHQRLGVLEVTQVGSRDDHALLAALAREGWRWESPGSRRWILHLSRARQMRTLRALVMHAVAICERLDVRRPEDLPWTVLRDDTDLRWLAWESEVELFSLGCAGGLQPQIDLLPPAFGGVVPDDWVGFEALVAKVLADDRVPDHIEKLQRRTDASERHLFLILTRAATGNDWYFKLLTPGRAPDTGVALPTGIDALWLSVDASWTICGRSDGWSLYPTPPPMLHASVE